MKKFNFIALLVLIVWSCDSNSPELITESNLVAPKDLAKKKVSANVMTWNIYWGTDASKVFSTSNPQEIPVLAAEAYQMLLATNFYERADAIADQIKKYKPDLIGLHEVALWRIQSPSDAIYGGTTPAEDVKFDYLQILMDAIKSRNMGYYVAGIVENIDGEVPMLTGFTSSGPTFDDIRLTDYDVVLARNDVQTSDVQEVNFAASLKTQYLELKRGYVSLDAVVSDKEFHFVTTHLERGDLTLPIQLAQTGEMITSLETEDKPVIIAGDLNSRPSDASYQLLVNSGYQDTWLINELQGNPDGFTAYYDSDLLRGALSRRIDHILVDSQGYTDIKVKAEVVGDEEEDRTVNGLWPSDHVGVVAEIKLKKD